MHMISSFRYYMKCIMFQNWKKRKCSGIWRYNVFHKAFHRLDNVVEDIARFQEITPVNAYTFKRFDFIFKTFIRLKSVWKGRTFEETERSINFSYEEADKRNCSPSEIKVTGSSGSVIKFSLQHVPNSNCLTLDHLPADGKKLYRLTFSRQFGNEHRK